MQNQRSLSSTNSISYPRGKLYFSLLLCDTVEQMLIKTYTKFRQNCLSFTLCILFGTVLIWLIWIHKWFNWWIYVEIKWSRPDTNPQVSFSLQIHHRCCCLKLSDGQMFKKIMIRSWLEASFNLYWMESGCCPHQACAREPRVGGIP